jgi:Flp pilus assembly protein TadD
MIVSNDRPSAMDKDAAIRRTSKAEALNVLGMRAVQRGDFAEAVSLFEQSATTDPSYADAQYNLARALKDAGRTAEALVVFRKVVALHPADADAWYTMGNTCVVLGEQQEAEQAYRRALELRPEDVKMYNNLAVALQALGRLDEADAVASVGLAIDPGYADLHYNRALVLLLQGRFTDGWKEFEHRFETSDHANPLRRGLQRQWTGGKLDGSTILLTAEQGLGDTIQFVRFARYLKDSGARVVVECAEELATLLLSVPGVDAVVPRGSALPAYDCWSPLLSVPAHAGLDNEHMFGMYVPYMFPDPAKVQEWQTRLAGFPSGMRVGCVWSGNPRHRNDRARSCPPGEFTALAAIPGIQFFSLQVRTDAAASQALFPMCNDLMANIRDFSDTAAFVSALDLVITVDTAVAHVAGALGKAVWLLLPKSPDWRWMLQRKDSPWYPSMTIYRQEHAGDWSGVFARIAGELRRMASIPQQPAAAPSGSGPMRNPVLRGALPRRDVRTLLDPAPLLSYADALVQSGNHKHAIDVYRRLLAFHPTIAPAWNNLGVCLQQEGDLSEAIAAFERAATLDATNGAVLNNFGYALSEYGVRVRAAEVLRRAIALDPKLAEAHNNMGNILRTEDDREGAQRAYETAIMCRPDFPEPHWNLAQLLLQSGDFEKGWIEYEWRWRRVDFTSPRRSFAHPQWNGEDVQGKTILVHAEQGFGDTLQFVRYLTMLHARGARIVLECQPELVRLFLGLPMVHTVIGTGSVLPAFDMHIPLLSLPRIFATTLRTIPKQIPYLTVHGADLRRWRSIITGEGPAVGIVWSGTQHLKALRNRTCPLPLMAPLFSVAGVRMYSLQVGGAAAELARVPTGFRPMDLSSYLRDFADTAAAVSLLDVVITIDTAVAHLAGALGRRVWLILPEDADWRWMRDRDDSPWYPEMRLYRERRGEGWGPVIGRVCEALRGLVNRHQGR